ncbi:STAS domain-containing protein [Streptomyces rimosus]|uniref:STAS domain-containing protein n=1 Tax=Streptomyces rimosus TaxID=1927 RepID=UPI000A8F3F39|nr:STAS domain-containing protein [Streptomyces rimosus]
MAAAIRCRATVPTVIVDVTAVNRMTIDALAILVRKAMRLHLAGGELLLAGPRPAVRKLVERTGTAALLGVTVGRAAAVRALAQDGRTWHQVDLGTGPSTLFPDPPEQTDAYRHIW